MSTVTSCPPTASRPRRLAVALVLALLSAAATAALAAGDAHANGTLTVNGVAGAGNVTGTGINCSTGATGDCTEAFVDEVECIEHDNKPPVCNSVPQEVTLTAAPGAGHKFGEWGGACAGETTNECVLSMGQNRTASVTFANAPPAVSLTKPEMSFWIHKQWNDTVALEASASDDSAVDRVEFLIGGSVVATDASAPYQHSLNTRTLPDGPVAVAVRAHDNGGKSTTFATDGVKIDNTDPAFVISDWLTRPTRGGENLGRVRISDAGYLYGNDYCWFDNNEMGGEYCLDAGVRLEEDNQYHLPGMLGLPDGEHTVTILAADAAGNTSTATRSFTLDRSPPNTTITGGPAQGSSTAASSASLGFSATEANASFRCRLYKAELFDTPDEPDFGQCSGQGATHSASNLAPGNYRFEVRATDAAGNVDPTPAARTFTLTAVPPPDNKTDTGGTGTGTGDTGNTGTPPSTQPDPPAQPTQPAQPTVPSQPTQPAQPARSKPGKCSKLKGKKRSACIKKSCGKLNKKKTRKQYAACVKKVTRKQ